jgi:hypothetical protein
MKAMLLAATLVIGVPVLALAQGAGANAAGNSAGKDTPDPAMGTGGTDAGTGTATGATSTGMMSRGGTIETPAPDPRSGQKDPPKPGVVIIPPDQGKAPGK